MTSVHLVYALLTTLIVVVVGVVVDRHALVDVTLLPRLQIDSLRASPGFCN